MGVLWLFFIYWIQFWDYEYLMHTLNILSLNVTGLNSAVKRTCVLEHLHRKSISGALICNTASSGTFLHVFWECPVVIDLWTRVNLVLSSSLQTDCFYRFVSSWWWFWSLYKLNTKEKVVCWFCCCEEDHDAELVCTARVWRGILDPWPPAGGDLWVCNGVSWWGQAFHCWCVTVFFLFFFYIRDYIKEGRVLLLLFPRGGQ